MADSETEFELKLTGPAEVIAALPTCALMQAVVNGQGQWSHLQTQYWDTPGGELARAGISLRERRVGRERRQTVKIGSGASRREIETPIGEGTEFPVTTAIPEIDNILIANIHSLQREITMNVDRWSVVAEFRNSQIEIAVDLGEAIAAQTEPDRDPDEQGPNGTARRRAAFAEVEFELLHGSREDVFSLAKLFMLSMGLRLQTASKLAHVKTLLDGTNGSVERRQKVEADPNERAGSVIQRALIRSAERIIALAAPITDMRASEGVHQMRVELRRFRAIERVCRRHVSGGALKRLAGQARGFARCLGPARDWDVFVKETLPTIEAHGYAADGIALLRARAHEKRAHAWGQAIAVVSSDDFARFTLDLLEVAHCAPWQPGPDAGDHPLNAPADRYAARALRRARRKTVETAHLIGAGEPATRHPIRVALKKMRYGVQLFRGLYPKDVRKPYMNAMTDLQRSFGAVNDAVVAQRLANELAEGAGNEAMRAAGFMTGFFSAKAEDAARTMDEDWQRFEQETPFWQG